MLKLVQVRTKDFITKKGDTYDSVSFLVDNEGKEIWLNFLKNKNQAFKKSTFVQEGKTTLLCDEFTSELNKAFQAGTAKVETNGKGHQFIQIPFELSKQFLQWDNDVNSMLEKLTK